MEQAATALEDDALVDAWATAEAELRNDGLEVVERFGPTQYMVMRAGGVVTNDPYSPPHGNSQTYWTPWAMLARVGDARSQQPSLCYVPVGTPDDRRTVGRIFARSEGVIVFAHPSGMTYSLIADAVTRFTALETDPRAFRDWATSTKARGWHSD